MSVERSGGDLNQVWRRAARDRAAGSQLLAAGHSFLYQKYSSSQNYYYTKDLNDVLGEIRSAASFVKEEQLRRLYKLSEYPAKIELLSKFYMYHNDIPRIFMMPIAEVFHNYYDKKRRINFIKMSRLLNYENNGENINGVYSDSSLSRQNDDDNDLSDRITGVDVLPQSLLASLMREQSIKERNEAEGDPQRGKRRQKQLRLYQRRNAETEQDNWIRGIDQQESRNQDTSSIHLQALLKDVFGRRSSTGKSPVHFGESFEGSSNFLSMRTLQPDEPSCRFGESEIMGSTVGFSKPAVENNHRNLEPTILRDSMLLKKKKNPNHVINLKVEQLNKLSKQEVGPKAFDTIFNAARRSQPNRDVLKFDPKTNQVTGTLSHQAVASYASVAQSGTSGVGGQPRASLTTAAASKPTVASHTHSAHPSYTGAGNIGNRTGLAYVTQQRTQTASMTAAGLATHQSKHSKNNEDYRNLNINININFNDRANNKGLAAGVPAAANSDKVAKTASMASQLVGSQGAHHLVGATRDRRRKRVAIGVDEEVIRRDYPKLNLFSLISKNKKGEGLSIHKNESGPPNGGGVGLGGSHPLAVSMNGLLQSSAQVSGVRAPASSDLKMFKSGSRAALTDVASDLTKLFKKKRSEPALARFASNTVGGILKKPSEPNKSTSPEKKRSVHQVMYLDREVEGFRDSKDGRLLANRVGAKKHSINASLSNMLDRNLIHRKSTEKPDAAKGGLQYQQNANGKSNKHIDIFERKRKGSVISGKHHHDQAQLQLRQQRSSKDGVGLRASSKNINDTKAGSHRNLLQRSSSKIDLKSNRQQQKGSKKQKRMFMSQDFRDSEGRINSLMLGAISGMGGYTTGQATGFTAAQQRQAITLEADGHQGRTDKHFRHQLKGAILSQASMLACNPLRKSSLFEPKLSLARESTVGDALGNSTYRSKRSGSKGGLQNAPSEADLVGGKRKKRDGNPLKFSAANIHQSTEPLQIAVKNKKPSEVFSSINHSRVKSDLRVPCFNRQSRDKLLY